MCRTFFFVLFLFFRLVLVSFGVWPETLHCVWERKKNSQIWALCNFGKPELDGWLSSGTRVSRTLQSLWGPQSGLFGAWETAVYTSNMELCLCVCMLLGLIKPTCARLPASRLTLKPKRGDLNTQHPVHQLKLTHTHTNSLLPSSLPLSVPLTLPPSRPVRHSFQQPEKGEGRGDTECNRTTAIHSAREVLRDCFRACCFLLFFFLPDGHPTPMTLLKRPQVALICSGLGRFPGSVCVVGGRLGSQWGD